MEIVLLLNGKTSEKYLEEGIKIYTDRLKHYVRFSSMVLPPIKNAQNLSPSQIKTLEGEKIIETLKKADFVVLLDEAGAQYSSRKFADFLQKNMNLSFKNIYFVVGGAFGFSKDVYERANAKISLSSMTFSHQMVRLFFVEQLYRAFTILNGEAYHND